MNPHPRRQRDALWLQQLRARLARMRVAKAARQTEAVAAAWPEENVLERIYLARHAAVPPVERKEERA